MMPRPIYRWKSFWLGMLVLGFLGWAWVQSMKDYGGIAISRPGGFYAEISQESRTIAVIKSTTTRPDDGFAMWSEPLSSDWAAPWFPRAFDCWETSGGWTAEFAHWFLMILFLVPWSAFLAWRWWKQRRLTETPA